MMKKLRCCCFVPVLLILVTMEHGCSGELRLLQIVFHNGMGHHGAHRPAPEATPPRDPYKVFWQTAPGKIALIGMIQLYRLGQRMRKKYGDFVPPGEVDLKPMERGDAAPCTSLSQCFMEGFYRPHKDSPPPGDPSWQLINNLPEGVDMASMGIGGSEPELKCPKLQEAAARLYDDSEEGNRIIGQYINLYQYWSVNSGMEIKNPTDARELYENLQLQRSVNNQSVPAWAERFWPELKRQSDIHFAWLAKNQNLQRMSAGPLLGLMIHRMERHIDGYDHKKYFVYSGGNSSLAGLLAIFGAFDGMEPALGSTVVLELHKFGALYYVRVLYFQSTGPHPDAPEVVTIRGCSEYCPFDKFRHLTTGLVPVRWQHDCGMWKGGAPAAATQPLLYMTGLAWLTLLFFTY